MPWKLQLEKGEKMGRSSTRRNDVRPKKVDGQRTLQTIFYKEDVLSPIIKGLFKLEMPDTWDRDYFLHNLIYRGLVIVTDTPAGVLALKGTLYGINYQQVPTNAKIVVPTLPAMTRTIGVDCELVYLERRFTNSFFTFNRLLDVYAQKLASADAAIDVNLMNSRAAWLAEAESQAQAQTIKEIYDRISEGDPMVVYRKDALSKEGLSVFFGNVKQNYIADLVQDSKRTIMNEFLTVLGINNANTDKRERLIVGEVESNNVELMVNTALWKERLKECQKRVNEMFPNVNFKIELQFDQQKLEEEQKNDIARQRTAMANSKSEQKVQ